MALAARITDSVGAHGGGAAPGTKLSETAGKGTATGIIAGLAIGIGLGALAVIGTAAVIATGGAALAVVGPALMVGVQTSAVLGTVSAAAGGAAMGLAWDAADKREQAENAGKPGPAAAAPPAAAAGAPAAKPARKMGSGCSALGEGSPDCYIEGQKAARVGDKNTHSRSCGANGSSTVSVNGKPLKRLGDKCTCGGVVITSASTVDIGGGTTTTAAAGPAAAKPEEGFFTRLGKSYDGMLAGDVGSTIEILNVVSTTTGFAAAAAGVPAAGASLARTAAMGGAVTMGRASLLGAPVVGAGVGGGMGAGHVAGEYAGSLATNEKDKILYSGVAGTVAGLGVGVGTGMAAQAGMGRAIGRPTKMLDTGMDPPANARDLSPELPPAPGQNEVAPPGAPAPSPPNGGTGARAMGNEPLRSVPAADDVRVTGDQFLVNKPGYQPDQVFGNKIAGAVNEVTARSQTGELPTLQSKLDVLAQRRQEIAAEARPKDQNDLLAIIDGTDSFGVPRPIYEQVEPLNLRGSASTGPGTKYADVPGRVFQEGGPDVVTIVGDANGTPVELSTFMRNADGGTMYNTPSANIPKALAQAESLHTKAMNPNLSPAETVQTVGEMHWWLAQAMPYERGSAAIADMAAKSVLSARGIRTSGWRDGVAPDIEALVTPDPKSFGQRYASLFERPPSPGRQPARPQAQPTAAAAEPAPCAACAPAAPQPSAQARTGAALAKAAETGRYNRNTEPQTAIPARAADAKTTLKNEGWGVRDVRNAPVNNHGPEFVRAYHAAGMRGDNARVFIKGVGRGGDPRTGNLTAELSPQAQRDVDLWVRDTEQYLRETYPDENLTVRSVAIGYGFRQTPQIHADQQGTYLHVTHTVDGPSTVFYPDYGPTGTGQPVIPPTGTSAILSGADRRIINGAKPTMHSSPSASASDVEGRVTLFMDVENATTTTVNGRAVPRIDADIAHFRRVVDTVEKPVAVLETPAERAARIAVSRKEASWDATRLLEDHGDSLPADVRAQAERYAAPAQQQQLQQQQQTRPMPTDAERAQQAAWQQQQGQRQPGGQTPAGQTEAPLRRLHPDATTEASSSYDYWRGRPTEEIVRSLKPGSEEPLIVDDAGLVWQGNTRVKVLQERGVNVDKLPREPKRRDNSSDDRWSPGQPAPSARSAASSSPSAARAAAEALFASPDTCGAACTAGSPPPATATAAAAAGGGLAPAPKMAPLKQVQDGAASTQHAPAPKRFAPPAKAGRNPSPAEAEAEIQSRYGNLVSKKSDLANKIDVLEPTAFEAKMRELVKRDDREVSDIGGLHTPNRIYLRSDGGEGSAYHELLHGYTSDSFWQLFKTTDNGKFNEGFVEGMTEWITRRDLGIDHGRPSGYDGVVAKVDDLARAVGPDTLVRGYLGSADDAANLYSAIAERHGDVDTYMRSFQAPLEAGFKAAKDWITNWRAGT